MLKEMENEYKLLKKGSSIINIPIIYEMDSVNNLLIMSYIHGENLCDILNNEITVYSEKKRLLFLLAEWFNKFHNYFRTSDNFYIRNDAILRNFIFSDKIWGVDFEEFRKGKPIEDIACMCASILTSDPMFTSEKFSLCQFFIESYSKSVKWNLENINKEVSYAILERIQWRPEEEKTFREFSNVIRNKGFLN